MRNLVLKAFSSPWHPWIFSVYPILMLYANNIKQAEILVVFRPLIISIALVCAVFLLLWAGLSNWHCAAFCTTAMTLLFFSYGHVYNAVKSASLFGMLLGRHRLLLLVWAGLAVAALLVSARKRINKDQTVTLNVTALILLLLPVFSIVSYWSAVRQVPLPDPGPEQRLAAEAGQVLPDVYYIVLDSYTRSDILKDVYGYDNSVFLNDLRELGFYIAECSSSNYIWTELSISSALNLGYLQDNPVYLAAAHKDVITEELIKHSLVRQTLEAIGYKTVAFATGFPFNEITDADLYLEPPASMQGVREFEALLVQTTLLRVLQDFDYIRINQTASAKFRDRTLFALDQFDAVARMGGPKFVYIHIITPHPPFVFGPNGESIDPKNFISTEGEYTDETYSEGYTGQVRFISDQIVRSIQELLDESPTAPIIILQGDHGPWKQQGENRVGILNAYYLPGHQEGLYPTISPVNSFRVIFNEYFGADYPLLEDRSYKSPYANVYDFKLQPTSCKSQP